MTAPVSELAWRLADYRRADVDPPHRCVTSPDLTEGQMMSDDEVDTFIKDSIATLRILGDHQSARFQAVQRSFEADLAYLAELGRISDDDYNELTHPDNFRF